MAFVLWLASASPVAAVTSAAITEFRIPGGSFEAQLAGAAEGPDGSVWFTDVPNDQIARLTPSGSVSKFNVAGFPTSIARGPDGNFWFIDQGAKEIGRITPTGTVKEFPIPSAITVTSSDPSPSGITPGPDGNIWFVDIANDEIGRITPTGTISEFPIPTPSSVPEGIAVGQDGNLWFTESNANKIGRITPTGVITEFPLPTPSSFPFSITSGPNGDLWFTEKGTDDIGRITVTGTVTELPVPTAHSGPTGITTGPDGNLWFTEQSANKIARMTPAGAITEFDVPSGAEPTGITTGSDRNLWFALLGPNADGGVVGRLNPTPPPTNISPPSISGTPQPGQTLIESHGLWANGPTAFSYQWEDCDSLGNGCTLIPGATGQTYELQPMDVGHTIRVAEIARNAGGSSRAAISASTAVVQAPPNTRAVLAVVGVHASGTSVTVQVTCTGGPGASCELTLALIATETLKAGKVVAVKPSKKAVKKVVVLGKTTETVSAGNTESARVKLNPRGKRLLAIHRRLAMKLVITSSGDRIATKRVTLKAKRTKKH